MRKIILFLLLFTIIAKDIPFAQEVGHLAMEVEMITTIGGTVVGIGGGFLVWLMDPGQPTPLRTHLHGGATLGTFLGMLGGAFLLAKSAIVPRHASLQPTRSTLVQNSTLSLVDRPSKYQNNYSAERLQQKDWSLSILHYRF